MSSKNYKERRIEVAGFAVDVVEYPERTFYYPSFNGDREYPATAKGFRELSSFLRTCRYFADQLRKYAPTCDPK